MSGCTNVNFQAVQQFVAEQSCLQVATISTKEVDFMPSNLWKMSLGLVYKDVYGMKLYVKYIIQMIVLQINYL